MVRDAARLSIPRPRVARSRADPSQRRPPAQRTARVPRRRGAQLRRRHAGVPRVPGRARGRPVPLPRGLVSGEALAGVAAAIELGEQLRLGTGELKSGGFRRDSILADRLEALFGAIYLDGGFDAAARRDPTAVRCRAWISCRPRRLKDPKTRLQEAAGPRAAAAEYGVEEIGARRTISGSSRAARWTRSVCAGRARARAGAAPSRPPRNSCSPLCAGAQEKSMNTNRPCRRKAPGHVALRLRGDRRPAERRQVDAAERVARPEGQHRQPKPQTTRTASSAS